MSTVSVYGREQFLESAEEVGCMGFDHVVQQGFDSMID